MTSLNFFARLTYNAKPHILLLKVLELQGYFLVLNVFQDVDFLPSEPSLQTEPISRPDVSVQSPTITSGHSSCGSMPATRNA